MGQHCHNFYRNQGQLQKGDSVVSKLAAIKPQCGVVLEGCRCLTNKLAATNLNVTLRARGQSTGYARSYHSALHFTLCREATGGRVWLRHMQECYTDMNEVIINAILITHLGWQRRCSETPADAPAPEKRSAQSLWWTPAVCKNSHQFSSLTIVAVVVVVVVVVVVGTAVVVSLIKSLIILLPPQWLRLSSESWPFHSRHYHFHCCTERESLNLRRDLHVCVTLLVQAAAQLVWHTCTEWRIAKGVPLEHVFLLPS